MNKLILAITLMLSMSANASNSELWLQSLMYVHHYDQDAWDWVEGFDNKAVGLEYRNGKHSAGAQTFINSYGDRVAGFHYSNRYRAGNGLSIGASVAINHGYREVNYSGENKRRNNSYLGKGLSYSSGLFVSYEHKSFELSLLSIGASAAALKFSFRVF